MRTRIYGSASLILAEHQDGPIGIAVDEGAVYWANTFEGTIMKYDLVAGRNIVMARGQDQPMGVGVDKKAVYWANNSEFGSVMRLAKDTALSSPTGDGGAPAGDAASVDASTDAPSGESVLDGEGTDCAGPRYQQCREDGICHDTYTDQWYCGCRQCGWNQHCLVGVCVY
jgi:hypothetical protein